MNKNFVYLTACHFNFNNTVKQTNFVKQTKRFLWFVKQSIHNYCPKNILVWEFRNFNEHVVLYAFVQHFSFSICEKRSPDANFITVIPHYPLLS